MDHKKILSKIDEAVLKEEMALPIYTSHITNALFWSGLDDEKKKKLLKI